MTATLFFLPTGRSMYAHEPDSAYIFAYGEENGSGLYFAWSNNRMCPAATTIWRRRYARHCT